MGLFDRASDAPVDVERLARDVHNALTSLREFIDNKSEDTEHNSRKVPRRVRGGGGRSTCSRRALCASSVSKRASRPAHRSITTVRQTGRSADTAATTPEYKAFFGWLQAKGNECDIKKAELELKSIQTKTLRTDSSPAGGYLVPQVMDATIKKNIIEVSPVRAHARLRIMRSKTLDIARRLSVPIATYEGEAESSPDRSVHLWKRADHRVSSNCDDTRHSGHDGVVRVRSRAGDRLRRGTVARPRRSEKFRLRQRHARARRASSSDSRVVPYTTTNSAAINWQRPREHRRSVEAWLSSLGSSSIARRSPICRD